MSRADIYASLSEIQKGRDGNSANTSKIDADAGRDAVLKELSSRLGGQRKSVLFPSVVQTSEIQADAPQLPPRKSSVYNTEHIHSHVTAQIAGIEEPAPPPLRRTRSNKEHIWPGMTSRDDKNISNPGREAPDLAPSKDERSANQKINLKSTKSTPNPSPHAPPQKSSAVMNRKASLSTEVSALPSQPRTSDCKTHNIHRPVDDPVLQRPVVDLKTNRTVQKSREKALLWSTVSEPPPMQVDAEHNKPSTKTSDPATANASETKPVPGIKPPPPSKPSLDKPLNNTAQRSTNGTLQTAPVKQVSQAFNKN